MRQRTLGERATFVAAAIGLAVGVLFLFAPIHGICSSTLVAATPLPAGATPGPTPTPSPVTCGVEALWQRQQLFPMPFLAVLTWSLAPSVVHLGARMRAQRREGTGTLLMIVGLVLAFTCIISFGAGPFFLPFVALPTLIATVIAFARS